MSNLKNQLLNSIRAARATHLAHRPKSWTQEDEIKMLRDEVEVLKRGLLAIAGIIDRDLPEKDKNDRIQRRTS